MTQKTKAAPISRSIRMIRKNMEITQLDFAESIGVTRRMLIHYEHGTRLPGYEVIMRILKEYKAVRTEYLLYNRGQIYKF